MNFKNAIMNFKNGIITERFYEKQGNMQKKMTWHEDCLLKVYKNKPRTDKEERMKYDIAFIGYGEAAYHISKGLASEKEIKMIAYDMIADDAERGPKICERMDSVGVMKAKDQEEAYKNAKFIVSLTSAAVAVSVAKGIIGNLESGQVYVDMNSAAPTSMTEIDQLPRKTGVGFCDVSLLGNVPKTGHRTKMMLSGDGAEEFYGFIKNYNTIVTLLDTPAGSASAIKMFKSVFSKGFPQLLLECLVPAAEYQVMDIVLDSFKHTFDDRTIEEFADETLFRTLVHAKRRGAEMQDVADTVEAMGFGAEVSRACSTRLKRLAEYDYAERIGDETPGLKEVVEMVRKDEHK